MELCNYRQYVARVEIDGLHSQSERTKGNFDKVGLAKHVTCPLLHVACLSDNVERSKGHTHIKIKSMDTDICERRLTSNTASSSSAAYIFNLHIMCRLSLQTLLL